MALIAAAHIDPIKALPAPVPVHDTLPRDDEIAIAIVDSPIAFLAMQAEWEALFARAGQPHQVFQSHAVLRHWMRHYLDSRTSLSIITGRRRGRLVMAWPLIRQRRFGVVSLRFMGVPVAQFGDVLIEPAECDGSLMQAGWDCLQRLDADVLDLRKLRADSALMRSGLVAGAVLRERLEAPFADLTFRVGPDGPSKAYASRERSNHRRRLRRLSERGVIAFGTLEPGPEAARLAVIAVAMKRASLLRHGIVAPTIADQRFSAFFHDLAGDAAGGSPLHITMITCDGEPIGLDLALDCKGTSFGHVIATHPEHERGGVGGILVHHSFASAKRRGNAIFDLLAPADAYKHEHADGLTAVSDLVLPLSWNGRLAANYGMLNWRPFLKQALRRLPSQLTRRLAAWSYGGKS